MSLLRSILVRFMSYSVMACLIGWMSGYEGGYNWDNTTVGSYAGANRLNIHPLVMVLGAIVCFTEGVLAWSLPFGSHRVKKLAVHFPFLAAGLTLVLYGLGTIITHKQAIGDKHFYSIHSWIGIITIALFVFNALGGIVMFLLPELFGANFPVKAEKRGGVVPYHAIAGVLIACFSVLSVITGVNNYSYYAGDQANSSPNVLGNFVAIAAILYLLLFVSYVLHRERGYSFVALFNWVGLTTPAAASNNQNPVQTDTMNVGPREDN